MSVPENHTSPEPNQAVLEVARAIRPCLVEQLGAELAGQLDAELAALLGESGDVEERIVELLGRHQATRDWAAAFLDHGWPPYLGPWDEMSAGYKPPVGDGPPIPPLARYACLQGDYVWYTRGVGEPVPDCPAHGQLVLAPMPEGGAR